MRKIRMRLMVAASVATLALGGCAGAHPEPAQAPAPAPAAPDEMSAAEIEALYAARRDSARVHFSQADVDFMTMMIGHHAQAIAMSRLAPTHHASPAVQRLAARIINAQEDEIATMERWLADRGQPVPEIHIDGLDVMVHGSDHALHMPGMVTQEQMEELDEAHGAEFDRLFLTYMIQHHNGAVAMVQQLFGTDGAGQDEDAFRLATDIQVDQITEVARMQSMLSQLPDGS